MTDDRSPIIPDAGSARVPHQVPAEASANDGDDNPAWWLRPAASLANELAATLDGLSSSEARSRLKRYGPNQAQGQRQMPLVWQFLRRFRNPLVLILVAASIVSALTGDLPSFGIIATMILLSVTLDFVQEHRAGKAAMRLSQSVALHLGDGINDAPALHSTDASLSVNTAVDVAKETADIILLRRDLRVVHDGVLEGRRTFANIRKYIMMGTSSNFGNMFSMAAASIFLPFFPMRPAQILLKPAPPGACSDLACRRTRSADASVHGIGEVLWFPTPST